MRTTKCLRNKILSFVLTLAMVITIFTVTAPEQVEAADKTLKGSGSSTVQFTDADCVDANGTVTHNIKYKAANTGYVTIKFQSASQKYTSGYGYVTFCDKNKKTLGESEEVWSTAYKDSAYYTRTYGVKKGQTYFFKVKSYGGFKMTATSKTVKKSNGNSRQKAKSLTKGKNASGVIIAGDSKADWYKIKMTQSKKLKLTYSAKTNGDSSKYGIKVTFFDKNGKKWTSDSYNTMTTGNPKNGMDIYMYSNFGSKHSIPTGTYWVKVERASKQSSGYYNIKWSTY